MNTTIQEIMGAEKTEILLKKYDSFGEGTISENMEYFGNAYLMEFNIPTSIRLNSSEVESLQFKVGTPFAFHNGKAYCLQFFKSDDEADEDAEMYENWEPISNVKMIQVNLESEN